MLILNEETQRENETIWQYIHPTVAQLSKKKFEDGYYNDAVRTAIIEICAIVRKFRKANGYDEIVSDVNMLRNTLKKENNILSFTNCNDESEKNIQKGYENLFAGAMEAIRNLNSHDNINMTEGDSVRKLMLISDLMYMLDIALERYQNVKNN